jgi:hypothetical protein
MTTALIIYFLLGENHRWEFLAIEPTDTVEYCELLAGELERMNVDRPGNVRVVCADDMRIWI